MKAIGFKLEEDLYKKIKLEAVQKDKSIKKYILDLVKKDIEQEKHPSYRPK